MSSLVKRLGLHGLSGIGSVALTMVRVLYWQILLQKSANANDLRLHALVEFDIHRVRFQLIAAMDAQSRVAF